jgi:hypothetical protein
MKPIYIPPFISPQRIDVIEAELLSLEWETKRTARSEYFMAMEPTDYSYGRQDDGISYMSKPFSTHVKDLMRDVDFEFLEAGFNGCFLNKYEDEKNFLGWHADDFVGMDPAAPIAVMSFGAEREIWVKRKFAPCPDCSPNRPGFSKSADNMCEGEIARDGLPVCETCGGSGCARCPECRDYRKMIHRDVVGGEVDMTKGVIVNCPVCHGKGGVAVTGAVPPEDRYLLERGSLFIMPAGFQEVMLHRIPKHHQPCGWRISLTFRKFL